MNWYGRSGVMAKLLRSPKKKKNTPLMERIEENVEYLDKLMDIECPGKYGQVKTPRWRRLCKASAKLRMLYNKFDEELNAEYYKYWRDDVSTNNE